jgi:hypothetical protein
MLLAIFPGTPARAAPTDSLSVELLARAGAWTAFRASGLAGSVLCGVDAVVGGRRLVSVEILSNGAAVRLFDPSWTFAAGTSVRLRVGIGSRGWEATVFGFGPLLEWRLGADDAVGFLAAFRRGTRIDLAPVGLGPVWRVSLAGSAAMLDVARACAGAAPTPVLPPETGRRRWL